MSKSCCPDCGSGNAVGKAEAWDAAAEVPPKVRAELDRLRKIENAAGAVLCARGVPGSESVVVQTVSVKVLDHLSDVIDTP